MNSYRTRPYRRNSSLFAELIGTNLRSCAKRKIITTAAAPEELHDQVLQLLREEIEDECCRAAADRGLPDASAA